MNYHDSRFTIRISFIVMLFHFWLLLLAYPVVLLLFIILYKSPLQLILVFLVFSDKIRSKITIKRQKKKIIKRETENQEKGILSNCSVRYPVLNMKQKNTVSGCIGQNDNYNSYGWEETFLLILFSNFNVN